MTVKKLRSAILILLLSPAIFVLHSQNARVDGYRGMWYSSGPKTEYGYRFSGGVATFESRIRPVAIYSPEVKKTFFVYGGTASPGESHLLIMISFYDHRSREVPRPVIVYDKMGVREPYDNASLSIDGEGFIWVFISGFYRTRPGLIFKSDKPYSIDTFELVGEKELMYPQPRWVDGEGFILMYSRRSKGLDLWFSSSPDGKSWPVDQKLVSMGGSLQVSDVNSGNIFMVFNYFPGGDVGKQTNLYLLKSEDRGMTWTTIDGHQVQVPLTKPLNDALVRDYSAEGKLVFLNDIDFDTNGNPVILVVISESPDPGPGAGPREWFVINRKNGEWAYNKVCESSHNYDRGFLDIEGSEWRVTGTIGPGPREYGTGGEIELWLSINEGASWHKEVNVTVNSINNNSFVRRPLNARKEFYALWADGDPEELSKSHLYFTNRNCNGVWMLPSDMVENRARPVRIK